MVRYGKVWTYVVRCAMEWYDVVWSGIVMVCCGVVLYGLV